MYTARKTAIAATALGASVALALAGCTATGSSSDDGGSSQEVSTSLPDDDITLTLSYVDDPPTEALVKGFEAKHSNITIKTTQVPFGDYIKSIQRSMDSDDPPDLAEYNPGAMRSLIPAGLVLNLDPYVKAYGWDQVFPASSLEALTSDKDAKQYNTGSLYAIPGSMSVTGVFYNKKLLTKAGISNPPKTLDEFTADLGKLKDAGIQPLSVGGLEVGGFQLWDALTNVLGNPDDYKNWIYGKDGATIKTDAAKKAAQDIIDWTKAGYIPKDASAVADSDALANFSHGKAAMLLTGNWNTAALNKAMGKDVGFFIMPGTSADATAVASGSSVAFSISAKSKHPNAAAAFLDYLGRADSAQIEVDSGFMPVDTDADVDQSPLGEEVAKGYTAAIDGAGIIAFPDYASPGMIDKLEAGVQGLITGHSSAADFLDSLQKEWSGYHD